MIKELDTVVLTRDIPSYALMKGDVGAVVHVSKDHLHYEVEFVTALGKTLGLLSLSSSDIRPFTGEEILHVRETIST